MKENKFGAFLFWEIEIYFSLLNEQSERGFGENVRMLSVRAGGVNL